MPNTYQSSYSGVAIDNAIRSINTTPIPTKVSDLSNDSHFITSASLPTKVSDLTNDSHFITSASLPTKVSDLTNDSNFTTSAAVTNLINSNVEYKTGSAILNLVFNAIYPIGCYYWSSDSTDPGTLFGGTWEQIQNTFLLAAGSTYTAGSTGGEAAHTLTVNEMPNHNHNYAQYVGSVGWSGSSPYNVVKTTNTDGYTNTSASGYMSTFDKGDGQAHNNMPPYLVAYCWHRTA